MIWIRSDLALFPFSPYLSKLAKRSNFWTCNFLETWQILCRWQAAIHFINYTLDVNHYQGFKIKLPESYPAGSISPDIFGWVAWNTEFCHPQFYYAQQNRNTFIVLVLFHQILKSEIHYSFTAFVSFHEGLKDEIFILLVLSHHHLQNEIYYSFIAFVSLHQGWKNEIFFFILLVLSLHHLNKEICFIFIPLVSSHYYTLYRVTATYRAFTLYYTRFECKRSLLFQ